MKELLGIITGFILVTLGLIGWFTRPDDPEPRADYDGLTGTPSEFDPETPHGTRAPDELNQKGYQ